MLSFLIVFICSYLLGCISTGYYLVKLKKRVNIREIGSGSTGATNVGRVLGKKGYFFTFLIDFAKGISVILLCNYLNFSETFTLLCGMALLCGHVWPIQLGFHGGKGISVMVGFFIIWNFTFLIISALVGLIVFLFIRKFTISGLIGILVIPVYCVVAQWNVQVICLLYLIIGIIFFAHRDNIKEYINLNFKIK
ncbi:MAG: glycerol-3-phosphate acyltransferase [Bacteroidota bacterium]|jgi:glycerol-3-phosphate acyltransferase PlsY